jgi:hypothetical protein
LELGRQLVAALVLSVQTVFFLVDPISLFEDSADLILDRA